MNDLARNLRTLLVCFVIALGVLIPIRVAQGGKGETVLGEVHEKEVELGCESGDYKDLVGAIEQRIEETEKLGLDVGLLVKAREALESGVCR